MPVEIGRDHSVADEVYHHKNVHWCSNTEESNRMWLLICVEDSVTKSWSSWECKVDVVCVVGWAYKFGSEWSVMPLMGILTSNSSGESRAT